MISEYCLTCSYKASSKAYQNEVLSHFYYTALLYVGMFHLSTDCDSQITSSLLEKDRHQKRQDIADSEKMVYSCSQDAHNFSRQHFSIEKLASAVYTKR